MRRCFLGLFWMALAGILIPVELGAGPGSQTTAPGALRVKKARVRGTTLAYVEQGRGEPVVLIHGFLSDYRVWSAQMDALAKRFRVIAYSQRYRYPFAPAPEGADTSLAADIEDLAGLIRTLKLGRAHLVGHSRGGNLAILFARKHPELVRSLILGEGPPPRPSGESEATGSGPPAFVVEARIAYRRGDTEGAFRIFAEGVLGPNHAPLQLDSRIPFDNAWQLRTLGVPDNSLPRFTCDDAGRIQVPTLLVEGELSPPRAHANVEAWQKCLPSVEHAVLARSSHGLQMENPAGFNDIVLAFLTRQSGRAGGTAP